VFYELFVSEKEGEFSSRKAT